MNVGCKIMDVDAPNTLKRCSSAPLINEGAATAATSPTTNTTPRSTFFGMFTNNLPRTRSNSMSCSPINQSAPISVANSCRGRLTPRVNQLRAEECEAVSNTREVAHEREVHTAMQMGQSYEDLSIFANSPTRIPRSFSPVVSPSPTRKFTMRRSLSPIALRASSFSPVSRTGALAAKRRWDEPDSPVCKRMCPDRLTPTPSTPGTPGTPGTPPTPDSDSLECTFRPVSPRSRPQPMNESCDALDNHKPTDPS